MSDDQEWRLLANCLEAEGDAFFPPSSVDYTRALAVLDRYCGPCLVTPSCLEFARQHEDPMGKPVIIGGRFRTTDREWTANELRAKLHRRWAS